MASKKHLEPKPSRDDSLDRFLLKGHRGPGPAEVQYLKGECQEQRPLF